MKIFQDGQLKPSYDEELHEFAGGQRGIYCNPVSDPDLPHGAFKEAAHCYATNCHMQLPGTQPVWDLEYDMTTYAVVREHLEEPMYKIMFVLEETEEGESHRLHAMTRENRDRAWIYPGPQDLHLSYARILIGLPPQPEAFRYGRYYVDPEVYEGIRQVVVREKDMYRCKC